MNEVPGLPRDVVALSIEEVWSAKPSHLAVLTKAEREEMARIRVEKRLRDWLAGRAAAKRAVAGALGLPLERITVVRSTEEATRGRPLAYAGDDPTPVGHVSITHAGDLALACFRKEPLGIDAEKVELREASFEALVLSERERTELAGSSGWDRAQRVTQLWCRKEAMSKWRGIGLSKPFDAFDVPPELSLEEGALVHRGEEMRWAFVTGAIR